MPRTEAFEAPLTDHLRISVTEEFGEKIRRMARSNRRSTNAQLRLMLDIAIKVIEEKPA
ncbi:MAG: hypothetical protein OXC11_00730 [Rhodospirillales bacterium]|nr:hypothetical protein [Rhodospirillales bacterium]